MISRKNVFYNAVGSAARLGSVPGDRWLMCLPLFHIGGLVMILRACLHGVCVVVHGKFEVAAVSQALDREDITLVSLVPTMLHRLYDVREGVPAQLRAVLLGGAAASEALLIESERRKVPVATTYGLTEATSQVATRMQNFNNPKHGSVGTPLLFTQVRITNEMGETVPAHTIGEICVTGPTVIAGYFDDVAATAQVIQSDELHTGDMGYLDDNGELWVVQRRSDLIVSGGENVYPAEVEPVIRQHAAVADACVVGLADAVWGQRVAAMVVLRPGYALPEDALLTFCRERLAGYKVPRAFKFVDALPMTANGKVARSVVQERMT
jgi:O-succinylbenzoic acid--CoA ligase